MKKEGYYGSGRPEIASPGASMEADFSGGPFGEEKNRATGGSGRGAHDLPRGSTTRGQHLKKGEKLSKEGGKLPSSLDEEARKCSSHVSSANDSDPHVDFSC